MFTARGNAENYNGDFRKEVEICSLSGFPIYPQTGEL